MGILYLLLFAVLSAGGYAWSIHRNPQRRCWHCDGSKTHDDPVWRGAIGRCWVCKGTGRRTRWGVMLFRRDIYRAIKAGQAGKNY